MTAVSSDELAREKTMDYRARIYARYHDSMAASIEFSQADDTYDAGLDEHVLPWLPHHRTKPTILDAGCGEGFALSWLRRRGYSPVGVDVSTQMLSAARARNPDTIIAEGQMSAFMRLYPGEFDVILSTDVLEHLTKAEVLDFLDTARGALAPGGQLIVHTVNAGGMSWGRVRYIDFTHEQSFTRHSLAQLFSVTGFSRWEFREVGPVGTGARASIRRLAWRALKLAIGAYYHVENGSGIVHNENIVTPTIMARAIA